MNQLDQIENRIKELIEKSTDLLPWTDHTAILIRRFCESLRQFLLENPDCLKQTPAEIHIYCSAEDMKQWNRLPAWQKIMLDAFTETVVELNCKPDLLPELKLTARNSLQNGQFVFMIEEGQFEKEKTGAVSLSRPLSSQKTKVKPDSGRVLINQDKSIPVDKAVINLGRKSSNDVVISDLRVSRFHAQIRRTKEGYMVFDVGSTGGTFVNGERITSQVLKSGDVISLAGYALVFTNEKDQDLIPEREITSDLTNPGGAK
ncbi:FHA domain-containing protein [bacterium]|nr:FHA domain-containing protein [bacterium]